MTEASQTLEVKSPHAENAVDKANAADPSQTQEVNNSPFTDTCVDPASVADAAQVNEVNESPHSDAADKAKEADPSVHGNVPESQNQSPEAVKAVVIQPKLPETGKVSVFWEPNPPGQPASAAPAETVAQPPAVPSADAQGARVAVAAQSEGASVDAPNQDAQHKAQAEVEKTVPVPEVPEPGQAQQAQRGDVEAAAEVPNQAAQPQPELLGDKDAQHAAVEKAARAALPAGHAQQAQPPAPLVAPRESAQPPQPVVVPAVPVAQAPALPGPVAGPSEAELTAMLQGMGAGTDGAGTSMLPQELLTALQAAPGQSAVAPTAEAPAGQAPLDPTVNSSSHKNSAMRLKRFMETEGDNFPHMQKLFSGSKEEPLLEHQQFLCYIIGVLYLF